MDWLPFRTRHNTALCSDGPWSQSCWFHRSSKSPDPTISWKVLQERQMVGRPSTSFLSRLWMFDNIPHMNHINYGGSRFSIQSSLTLTRQISRPISCFETPQLAWSPFLCETILRFSSPQMHAHMSFDGCCKVSSPTRYTWNVDLDLFFNFGTSEALKWLSLLQVFSWTWLFTTPGESWKSSPLQTGPHLQIPCPNSSAVHQLQQTLKPTVPLREGWLHCHCGH